MTDIRFYCGINEMSWNHRPTAPGEQACVSPVYGRTERSKRTNGVRLPRETKVLQDSGAFVDSWGQRLSFAAALQRQEKHAEQYGYADRIEYRVSYDLLIDEVWEEGSRTKRRWSVEQAEAAVDETVAAAKYYHEHRNGNPLFLAVQGVSAEQYQRCAERILPYLRDGDCLGLGGWCIIGRRPYEMMPVFHTTIERLIPFLGVEGVKRVHLFGVCFAPALGKLLYQCRQAGIQPSTDSAGPNIRPTRRSDNWGYAEWIDRHYVRHPIETMGLERARHVQLTRAWLDRFASTVHCTERQVLDFRGGNQIMTTRARQKKNQNLQPALF